MMNGHLTLSYPECVSRYQGIESKPIFYPPATGFATIFETLMVEEMLENLTTNQNCDSAV